ncbi:hypothetical protein QR680_013365 [Steinernema hermaphroditum]|uniref:NIPSNAP domain-containing protein n=1 Tax=Steinernema hermaphroditum TaxID=289476 RepID=A0AA39I6U2_9BILA|nr:hypothetical protein QR680_013365 [Steinernema hermaphroditum]
MIPLGSRVALAARLPVVQRQVLCCYFSTEKSGDGTKGETTESGDCSKKQQGWISRMLTGPQFNPDSIQKQSHSSLLSNSEFIYELTTHDTKPGHHERYLTSFGNFSNEVTRAVPGAELVGSWSVVFGNQDQVVNLWRYNNGYIDVDAYMLARGQDTSVRAAFDDLGKDCLRRRSVLMKSFSYWGDPKPRDASHVYDLRSYVLKPGTMIEWGNSWAKGITYRREHNQDVGGFFAQVGQLYMVFHIWAYKNMVSRNDTRQQTWLKPGWDNTVAYTVPLIKKMKSRILVPTKYSQLK